MKILSNRKYGSLMDQIDCLTKEVKSLSAEGFGLCEKVKRLEEERAYVNLSRDSNGVLHRINETKDSRVNRKTKAGKFAIGDIVEWSGNHPAVGIIIRRRDFGSDECYELYVIDAKVNYNSCSALLLAKLTNKLAIKEFMSNLEKSGKQWNAKKKVIEDIKPKYKTVKAKTVKSKKFEPQSEETLRKMIDSKSSKELAEEYLGLKVGDGKICGYDDEGIILGFNELGVGWHCANSADTILSNYKSYLYAEGVDGEKVRSAILKSLNPR